jgi:SAM-dependent methyltransferase
MEIEDFKKSFFARAFRRLNVSFGKGRLTSLMPLMRFYRRMICRSVLEGTTFRDAIRPLRAGDYGIYLENRFSHPSLLASIPVIALFPSLGARTILDLGSGAGHHAYLIASFMPDAELTCTDKSYINLYLLRRFMAPEAKLICHNLDFPLPFDDPFDIVFSSDVLHYIVNQKETAAECMRLTKPEGHLFLCHLHNAMVYNFVPGHPLTPSQWRGLFEEIPHQVYPEDGILKDFVSRNRFDLGALPDESALEISNGLIIAASRTQDVRKLSVDDPFARMVDRDVRWVPNPIYKRVRGDGEKDLYEFTWFTENYKKECPQLAEIMPEKVELPAGLEALKPVRASREDLLEMARKLAVVNMPDSYA